MVLEIDETIRFRPGPTVIEHIVVDTVKDEVLIGCGMWHPEGTSYLDCPVASRWTLLRTP